jgi:hypothetical protein
LAERLGYDTVCIDDLVAAVRAVTTMATHPKIHATTEIDYREYHIQNTAETLWRDGCATGNLAGRRVDCASPCPTWKPGGFSPTCPPRRGGLVWIDVLPRRDRRGGADEPRGRARAAAFSL